MEYTQTSSASDYIELSSDPRSNKQGIELTDFKQPVLDIQGLVRSPPSNIGIEQLLPTKKLTTPKPPTNWI